MHHPLDVLGGAAVGVATLVAVVLICRATGYAVAARDRRRHPDLEAGSVSKVAVIAHSGQVIRRRLLELRRELERNGIVDPLWYEIPKSKHAPKQVKGARSRPEPV
jgi:hypothetical protein